MISSSMELTISGKVLNQRCMCVEKAVFTCRNHPFQGSAHDMCRGPCYRCVFKESAAKDAVPTCKQAGVIGAMGGVISSSGYGGYQVFNRCWKLLTGYLLTYDALTMEFHKIKLPKGYTQLYSLWRPSKPFSSQSTTSRRSARETL